jgi:potassium channel LctB
MLTVVVCLMIGSLRWVWTSRRNTIQSISIDHFLVLFMTYACLFIGFGAMYTFIHISVGPTLIHNESPLSGSFFELMESGLYFSAVTILSLGYGDITPVGFGRGLAVIEALLGYVLPAAFVVRTVIDIEKEID